MMQHHKYSLTELENMMPWEREIYLGLLQEHLKEEDDLTNQEKADLIAFLKTLTDYDYITSE